MKKKLLLILLVVGMTASFAVGCGNGTNKTAEDVSPVVESEEIAEAENVEENMIEENEAIEVPEDTETVEDATEEILVVDESILDEPLPETLEEMVATMRAIPNGQLLSDYMFKVLEEMDYEKISDQDWTNELGAYIDELKETNPEMLQEFYDAEVK